MDFLFFKKLFNYLKMYILDKNRVRNNVILKIKDFSLPPDPNYMDFVDENDIKILFGCVDGFQSKLRNIYTFKEAFSIDDKIKDVVELVIFFENIPSEWQMEKIFNSYCNFYSKKMVGQKYLMYFSNKLFTPKKLGSKHFLRSLEVLKLEFFRKSEEKTEFNFDENDEKNSEFFLNYQEKLQNKAEYFDIRQTTNKMFFYFERIIKDDDFYGFISKKYHNKYLYILQLGNILSKKRYEVYFVFNKDSYTLEGAVFIDGSVYNNSHQFYQKNTFHRFDLSIFFKNITKLMNTSLNENLFENSVNKCNIFFDELIFIHPEYRTMKTSKFYKNSFDKLFEKISKIPLLFIETCNDKDIKTDFEIFYYGFEKINLNYDFLNYLNSDFFNTINSYEQRTVERNIYLRKGVYNSEIFKKIEIFFKNDEKIKLLKLNEIKNWLKKNKKIFLQINSAIDNGIEINYYFLFEIDKYEDPCVNFTFFTDCTDFLWISNQLYDSIWLFLTQ
ncbi:hypothetical protein CWI39_2464p0010 [Hamiltosporidium magnivora]|uniref:Uncharacterized protein n=1 Tax=Hamiltosporidium magnivora TaxID=148818 RepID=A0A4Q9KVN5_9MICR|nr:hypothetical protein CWI39_2464p0010 [Hamiltosporidium magnivora]